MTPFTAGPDAPDCTIEGLHAAYAGGRRTPSDVVARFLARPAAELQAPIWLQRVRDEDLLARARALDGVLRQDPDVLRRQPLFGALFGVKDNFDVAGLATTAACPNFARVAASTAPAVARLLDGGAMLAGKLNMDQFGLGLTGTRTPYGTAPNALRPEYIPGGSSSGPAVAVALGQVHFALGTDTAGSGRVPAALNNIVGLKPTRGLISTRGVVPACRSLDCVSLFALTIPDAWRVLDVTRGFDGDDPYSRDLPPQAPASRETFVFAVPDSLEFFGDAGARDAFGAAVDLLQRMGGTPRAIDFSPFAEAGALLFTGPWVAERISAIRPFFEAHADTMLPVVRAVLAEGARCGAVEAMTALDRLAALRQATRGLWRDVDVLALPTVPTHYTIAEVVADPFTPNRRLGTYASCVNMLDLAAVAVPAAMRPDGLPAGLSLIGPAGSDPILAAIGHRLHCGAQLRLGALPASLGAASLNP